jgi:hypothetical protein
VFKNLGGTLRRGKEPGEYDAKVPGLPIIARRQGRSDYSNFFLFLYLRADTHSQAIAAEVLMNYGLGILPPFVGVVRIDRLMGIIDWHSCWHRRGSADAHALRRQDAWPGALHSEKP